MKHKFARRLGAALFAMTLAASAQAQVEWNHNSESDIGPNFWGSLTFPFATCGSQFDPVAQTLEPAVVEVGKKQTPVDIVTTATQLAALPALAFLYKPTPFVVDNTGHVVEVPYAPGNNLRVGLDTYELLQFHFHAPSEHTVNGRPAAGELHLVHRNVKGELAVVGVLLKVGHPANRLIDDVIMKAPLKEGSAEFPGATLNARDVLPRHVSYYNYTGSLTTPPCTEGVHWFVLKEPVLVSQAAIDQLHAIISGFPGYEGYPDNNRPVRPLNGRVILNRLGH